MYSPTRPGSGPAARGCTRSVVSLPAPDGRFQRFALPGGDHGARAGSASTPRSPPTAGGASTIPAATIPADLSPFGFHASVRSPNGGWYIDPYYRKNPNDYVSYHGQQLKRSFPSPSRRRAGDERAATRSRPLAPTATGRRLRTYRLALITDPGYSDYVGGPANVTAAKVALINRVDQVYEDDMSFRMELIANNDLLNLNTWGAATAPNGPCGAAACFTQSQVTCCSSTTRARFVIGQIIGAVELRHRPPRARPAGRRRGQPRRRRRLEQGGRLHGDPDAGRRLLRDRLRGPRDGPPVQRNHPFNGNQLNCSGGNRNAATSVEPGSGSSIMAYAGICLTDDLQPHSDPYFSQRSQQETRPTRQRTRPRSTRSRRRRSSTSAAATRCRSSPSGPATSRPHGPALTVAIGARSERDALGGVSEKGNTVTVATGAPAHAHAEGR